MQSPSIDARALSESGVEALRRGDPRKARDAFEQIVEAGRADASACIGLAYACRSLNDKAASLAAVDKALSLEPRNLRALILKADHLAEAATRVPLRRSISPPPKAPGRRPACHSTCARNCERAQGDVRPVCGGIREPSSAIACSAPDPTARRAERRFAQSLDILFGKKRVYSQAAALLLFSRASADPVLRPERLSLASTRSKPRPPTSAASWPRS